MPEANKNAAPLHIIWSYAVGRVSHKTKCINTNQKVS